MIDEIIGENGGTRVDHLGWNWSSAPRRFWLAAQQFLFPNTFVASHCPLIFQRDYDNILNEEW